MRRSSIGTRWVPGRHAYGCRTVRSPARIRAFLLALFVLTGCRIPSEPRVDTVFVHDVRVDSVSVPHTDTLLVQHTDTLPARVDTVTTVVRVPVPYPDTVLVSVPVHDTLPARVDTLVRWDTLWRTVTVVHVDTVPVIVQRTDTLYLPGAVVHDSTWIYVQQNPTNPLGGGDPHAGVAWIDTPTMLPAGFAWALVFWHGNFVGIVSQTTPVDLSSPTGRSEYWEAWPYLLGGGTMPYGGRFPTKLDAIASLLPIVLTLTPHSP